MTFHTIHRARGALLLGTFVCTAALAAPASASPVAIGGEGYFVQTSVNAGASYFITGTTDNDSVSNADGGTQADTAKSSASATDASVDSVINPNVSAYANGEARANLADGTLKAYALASNGSTSGNDNVSASAYALARMGDTLTFANGAGTNVGVTLDIDGSIFSSAPDLSVAFGSQVQFDAYIAVYDASAGADSSNWACPFFGGCTNVTNPTSGPLGQDRFTLTFDNHATEIDQLVSHLLSTTVTLGSDNQALKVFGHLSLLANRMDDNAGDTEFDFLNTATFGVNTGSGVSFTSASGVFPGSGASAVPIPAAGLSLFTGLLALFGVRRRRRPA